MRLLLRVYRAMELYARYRSEEKISGCVAGQVCQVPMRNQLQFPVWSRHFR